MNRRIKSKYINSFDIETLEVNFSFYPICLCIYFRNKYYSFFGDSCIFDFFKFINTNLYYNIRYIFYIHNINFDGLLLIEYFLKNNIDFDMFAIKTNIYFIRYNIGNLSIEWRCSYKLLPSSLNNIGINMLNIYKLPYPYNVLNKKINNMPNILRIYNFNSEYEYNRYILINFSNSFNFKNYTIRYCIRDVKITQLFVKKYWEVLKIFNIKPNSNSYSASSISVKLFFSKFNKFKINKSLDISVDNYVREAYYGGRCEVFGNVLDNEKIYHFDFSGMYGQCMLEKFPIGNYRFIYNNFDINIPGFYFIDGYINEDFNIPILPYKTIDTNKLMFYSGFCSGLYWFEEIQLFIEFGGIILNIHSGIIFNDMEFVFYDFISELNKIRNLGGEYKLIGKLMINSLYGRLGMKSSNLRTIVFNYSDLNKWEHLIYDFKRINNIIIADIVSNNHKKDISNIIMAACITSKARIKLYRGFISTIDNGGRLLYCDTDSIISAYKYDVNGMTFGEIYYNEKDELTKIDDAVFAKPKAYSIKYNNKEITKIKGYTRNIISFNDFKHKFYNDKPVIINMYKYFKRLNYKISFDNYKHKITDLNTYDKRIFSKCKKFTHPIIIKNNK